SLRTPLVIAGPSRRVWKIYLLWRPMNVPCSMPMSSVNRHPLFFPCHRSTVMTNSSLPKKLQMKPGQRAVVINAPAGYLSKLVPLPDGVEIAATPEGQFDFVQLFVNDLAQLQALLPLAVQAVKPDALLWIAYPKGSAKTGTDLNRDRLWAAVSEHHL